MRDTRRGSPGGSAGDDLEQLARGECTAMGPVLSRLRIVAPTRATVLLTGETGVGKSLVARLIHRWSNRRDGPFVEVCCGAVPESLLESELFGHERGAFTGAHRRQHGSFELADGGTLLLDEIGAVPPLAQVKLLNVLQERAFHRLGGEQEITVDVRILAATNSDLREMQRDGSFRSDLFHRLNVFPVEIPPLRERIADLPPLVAHMLERLAASYGKRISGLEPDIERAFRAYTWPGNVRELDNVIERAFLLESGERISAASVPAEIVDSPAARCEPPAPDAGPTSTLAEARAHAVAEAERRYLTALLSRFDGRMDASADAAGVTTRQLRKLLHRHDIHRTDFKRHRDAWGPAADDDT